MQQKESGVYSYDDSRPKWCLHVVTKVLLI